MIMRFIVIFASVFAAMLGLNTVIAADIDDMTTDIVIEKKVDSYGETYGIGFEIDMSKEVRSVLIKVPYRKNMLIQNTLGLDEIELGVGDMSYEEFKKRFPEGKYSVIRFPNKYGRWTVNITHDFPPTPVITYPPDGSTVPLTFTMEWEPLSGINRIEMEINASIESSPEIDFEVDLPPDVTSFTFPIGLLQPNTHYTLEFKAEMTIEDGNKLEKRTSRIINFTTEAE